jgi:hypothetical protein
MVTINRYIKKFQQLKQRKSGIMGMMEMMVMIKCGLTIFGMKILEIWDGFVHFGHGT